MNYKQRAIYRLAGEILDVVCPNEGEPLSEKSMAVFSLKQAAALVRVLFKDEAEATDTPPSKPKGTP